MKTIKKTQILIEAISAKLGLDPSVGPTWADLAEGFVPIHWDWPGWLSPGFLTVLAGQPGTGKSSLCLRLAASYSDGRPWPDGTPFTATPGKTLWIEGEGGHRANLARLQSWGLDSAQIVTPFFNSLYPQQNFNLAGKENITDLLLSASRDDVRLIVFDSLNGLLSGAISPPVIHDLLDSLAHLARFVNKPILLTHNLHQPTIVNGSGHPNLNRLLSSPVMAQLPRLIWALDLPDPADPTNRRLSVIKNNLALSPDPLGFRIDDHGLHFGPSPQPHTSQLDHAMTFLEDLLAGGPLPAAQVKAAAQAAGLAPPTLKRAKKQLRIKSNKQPNQWTWQLPPKHYKEQVVGGAD